jgi:hypothetical protein
MKQNYRLQNKILEQEEQMINYQMRLQHIVKIQKD